MKKILIGCAVAMFTMTAFAGNFSVQTEADQVVRASSQAEQLRTDNDERRYYILTGAVSYQDLQGNILFKNIKMDKRPEPMRPVPAAQ